jgi:hypothetical protein
MTKMVITDALAELSLIEKKISSAHKFRLDYLTRPEDRKDPLEKDGTTSEKEVESASQAVSDLQTRKVAIRLAINKANMENSLTVMGNTMKIAEWLIWKREIRNGQSKMLNDLRQSIAKAHLKSTAGKTALEAHRQTGRPLPEGIEAVSGNMVVNMSEVRLKDLIETHMEVEERLDGRLSVADATIEIEIPD